MAFMACLSLAASQGRGRQSGRERRPGRGQWARGRLKASCLKATQRAPKVHVLGRFGGTSLERPAISHARAPKRTPPIRCAEEGSGGSHDMPGALVWHSGAGDSRALKRAPADHIKTSRRVVPERANGAREAMAKRGLKAPRAGRTQPTTKLTRRLGTKTSLRMVLPSSWAAILASALARAMTASLSASAAT